MRVNSYDRCVRRREWTRAASERLLVLALAVALVLAGQLVAGCGGSDDRSARDAAGPDDVTGAPSLPDAAAEDAGADAAHDVRADVRADGSADTSAPPEDAGADAAAGTPNLDVHPLELAFGPRRVGAEARASVRLLSRGDAPVTVTGVSLDPGASPDFGLDLSGLGRPAPGAPLVLEPDGEAAFEVTFTPARLAEVDDASETPLQETATLVVESTGGRLEVPLSGYGVACDGPVAVITVAPGDEVAPGTDLHLYGTQSYAKVGSILKWEWRIDQPVGSQSVFVPSPTFPNPTFEANAGGTYTIYLDVWDERNVKCCDTAVQEVVVIPDGGAFRAELLWTTPNDPDETDTGPGAGADLDLHLLHPSAPSDAAAPDLDGDGAPDPYFDPVYDCWSGNPAPDWGSAGAEYPDDPLLEPSDADGAGPEAVGLVVPQNGVEYRVAVHYPHAFGHGASFATVRIYLYQVLVFELSNIRLLEGDLWSVATIAWPSGRVDLVEAPGGGYSITRDYPLPD